MTRPMTLREIAETLTQVRSDLLALELVCTGERAVADDDVATIGQDREALREIVQAIREHTLTNEE